MSGNGRHLRILHTEASNGWGGQEIRILDEAVGLRERGHDVQVAAPPKAPIFAAAVKRGIPIHPVAIDRRSLPSLFSLMSLIRRLQPDLVVTHSSSDSWLAAIATRFPGTRVPLVRMRHLSTPVAHGMLNRWLYGRVPARVVTTGEAVRKLLIDSLGLDRGKVVSVPTGADLSRFQPGDRAKARAELGLPANDPIVGIVATLRSWKGHRFLIAALRDPRLAPVRLVIVGDGPQQAALREQATADGLAQRVVFAGQQEDVVLWLQAFDVFALPSTGHEGVPQALIQAMACGLPVVTTAVGAIPELVRDGESGLVVPSEDVPALAAAIARLLGDPALCARLAANARTTAARHGDQVMLDAMETVLRQAATQPR
jgi:glycosyltransferase involved in cell wall biosynthesis